MPPSSTVMLSYTSPASHVNGLTPAQSANEFKCLRSHSLWRTPYISLRKQVCHFRTVVCEESRSTSSKNEKNTSIEVYRRIERVFTDSGQLYINGPRLDTRSKWQLVEGSWVVSPASGRSTAVVHFIGGAFVGASPQLLYRLFLDSLADRGLTVVATPYSTGFDHLRIADEAQLKFDTCMRTLYMQDSQLTSLPVFGIGHSLGALTHVLIGSRYGVERAANVLISFNNRESREAIPVLSTAILPLLQRLSPLLSSLSANSILNLPTAYILEKLESLNPSLARSVSPFLEQLPSLYEDLQNGTEEFVPSASDTDRLVKAYYGVQRNLVLGFKDDTIDQSLHLAEVLRLAANVGPAQVTLRILPGSHVRPLQQTLPEVPPELADIISRGTSFLSSMAPNSPLAGIAAGIGRTLDADKLRQSTVADMDELVDEVVDWMRSPSFQFQRSLPLY